MTTFKFDDDGLQEFVERLELKVGKAKIGQYVEAFRKFGLEDVESLECFTTLASLSNTFGPYLTGGQILVFFRAICNRFSYRFDNSVSASQFNQSKLNDSIAASVSSQFDNSIVARGGVQGSGDDDHLGLVEGNSGRHEATTAPRASSSPIAPQVAQQVGEDST